MPTTYTNGLKLPDLGSIDWYNSYKNNIDILDPIVGTVNGVATTYAPISHSHSASEITSGTIDIARLPPAALERLHIVADQTARYALTTSTVQEGDTVKQTDTGVMYLVVDATKLNSADGYTEYSAGTASKAIADEDGTSIKSGYVNRTTNQSIAGQKTFYDNTFFPSPVYHKNTTYEIGNIPASNIVTNIYLADKNNIYTSFVRSVIYASGRTATEIRAKNAFKNGILDPTGSDINSNLNVEVQPNGDKTLYFDGSIRNNVLPYATNTYSLGSSTNQWLSVYAQTYYYNGTAWGLDKANTWTQNQSVVNAITPKFILQDTRNDRTYSASTSLSGGVMRWECDDKDGAPLSRISTTFRSDKAVQLQFSIFNEDSTGTEFDRTLRLVAARDTTVPASFYPEQTDTVNLGTSSNRWSAVYAQSYYYNGTAWGLNKANTWTNVNTFSMATSESIAVKHTTYKGAILFRTNGVSNFKNYNTFLKWDINGYDNSLGLYRSVGVLDDTTTGATDEDIDTSFSLWKAHIRSKSLDFTNSVKATNDGTENSLKPITTSVTDLGTSTNKWKTLNGVNPGALSLPVTANNVSFNIDTTNWATDGTIISYTPLLDGWLYINARNDGTNGDSFIIFDDAVSGFGTSVFGNKGLPNNGVGLLCLMMPVNKNNSVIIRIKSPGIISARLYPCQGNV